mgnify:FL=1
MSKQFSDGLSEMEKENRKLEEEIKTECAKYSNQESKYPIRLKNQIRKHDLNAIVIIVQNILALYEADDYAKLSTPEDVLKVLNPDSLLDTDITISGMDINKALKDWQIIRNYIPLPLLEKVEPLNGAD